MFISFELLACQPANNAEQEFEVQSGQNKQHDNTAPQVADLNLEKYKVLELSYPIPTAQNYKINFEYRADESPETIYFNQQGEVIKEAVADGYYRLILGTTADGRTVSQDFYQDSKTPLNSAYILKDNPAATNISDTKHEGRIAVFSKEGNLVEIAQKVNNEIIDILFLENGAYTMQTLSPNLNQDIVISYNNKKIKSVLSTKTGEQEKSNTHFITFYENGSALGEIENNSFTKGLSKQQTWNKQGVKDDSPKTIEYFEKNLKDFGVKLNKTGH